MNGRLTLLNAKSPNQQESCRAARLGGKGAFVMIFDNRYWQAELGRLAVALRRHGIQRRWVAASDAAVEKRVMLGFYSIRKMMESFHPPPFFENPAGVRVTAFPRSTVKPSSISFPEVGEAFDLRRARAETLSLRETCNQVVHSHFFSLWFGHDRRLRGVFVCSDKVRDKEIYRLDLGRTIDLFEAVARSRRRVASLAHFYPEHNRVCM